MENVRAPRTRPARSSRAAGGGEGRRRTARARHLAGYTLMELVVVAAVSSLLFLVLIRWVLTLGAASSMTLDNSAAQRAADVARDAFADDVSNATFCSMSQYSPIRSISPNSVSFSILNGNGQAQEVTWKITDSTLQRVLRAPSGSLANPCAAGDVTSTKTYADNVRTIQTDEILSGTPGLSPGFYPITDAQNVTDPTLAWGSCASGETADRCLATALGVNWILLSPIDKGAPIAVARSYTFPATTKGLS